MIELFTEVGKGAREPGWIQGIRWRTKEVEALPVPGLEGSAKETVLPEPGGLQPWEKGVPCQHCLEAGKWGGESTT